MYHEVGVQAEGLAALGAPKPLLPAVGALVHPDVPGAAEGMAALKGLVARVRPLVEGEARAPVGGLGAVPALEWLCSHGGSSRAR